MVAARAMCAEGALERMRGLLGRPALTRGEGMLLEPCSSVHTFGMRDEIDLVFLSRVMEVVKLTPRLRPLRIAWALGAGAALELWPGAIEEMKLVCGARLRWEQTA